MMVLNSQQQYDNIKQRGMSRRRHGASIAYGAESRINVALSELEETGFVQGERLKGWARSVKRIDPRQQIQTFFDDVARDGGVAACIDGADQRHSSVHNPKLQSPLLRGFHRSSVFTVWRPTSRDSIRQMMMGKGVGKSLDIKGKSAKRGKYSSYVPYLQIHQDEHRKKLHRVSKNAKVRVFYGTKESRDAAYIGLSKVADEMKNEVEKASQDVDGLPKVAGSRGEMLNRQASLETLQFCDCKDWSLLRLDPPSATSNKSCWGLEVSLRVLWEGCVMRSSIERAIGSDQDTGRPSQPAFQDMNHASLTKEKKEGRPKVVLWQFGNHVDEALDPRSLVMAYEEEEHDGEGEVSMRRVMPVVSDFDCFIVGTRNVPYERPLPPNQVQLAHWCISEIEGILESPTEDNACWTKRWFEVLKEVSAKKSKPDIPRYGFGDPTSYAIMEAAAGRLKDSGAVQHGAECFNYLFPQEIDDHYLVISDTLPGNVPWKYVDLEELQGILCEKIDEGFTFPINPKWVLCDPGWKKVYDKLFASNLPTIKQSLDAWYPPGSGLRERIAEVHARHPSGFGRGKPDETGDLIGREAMDLAKQELRWHMTLQRAKRKFRAFFVLGMTRYIDA